MYCIFLLLVATFVVIEIIFLLRNDDHDVQYMAETYRIEMAKKDHLVMFYTTWCEQSRNLMPTWEQLAQQRNGITGGRIGIAKLNCDDYDAICVANNVTGLPTVKFFKAGNSTGIEYFGSLSLESLNEFIENRLQQNGTAVNATLQV